VTTGSEIEGGSPGFRYFTHPRWPNAVVVVKTWTGAAVTVLERHRWSRD
jgi:hypothetical protein